MPRSSTGTDRLARTLAVLLALIAVASVTTAWLIQHHAAQQRAAVSDNVPPSLLGGSASLVTSAPPPAARTSTGATRASTSTARAAVVVSPIVPAHLFVPSIGVNTSVLPKPTEMAEDPFLNKVVPSFGVPDDMYSTTWWSSGPKPGSRGMAVILGHTQIGGYGVFNDLARLKPGAVIGVARGTTTLRFVVLSVHTGISKKDPAALQTTLSEHPADARLALLTCSGYFNQGFRESAENTVVFAKLVSASR